MNHLLALCAVIVFVLAAIAFWWINAWTLKTDFGFLAAGLALLAASLLPLSEYVRRP